MNRVRSEYTLEEAAQAITGQLARGWSAEALFGTDLEESYRITDADGEYVCTVTIGQQVKHAPGPLFATRAQINSSPQTAELNAAPSLADALKASLRAAIGK